MIKARILIIEDEQIIAYDLQITLQKHGYEIVGNAASALEAIEIVQTQPIDLMIVDYKLDGTLDGEEAVSAVRSYFGKPIPVIFISGATQTEFTRRIENEPCAILMKPLNFEELLACIETLLQ